MNFLVARGSREEDTIQQMGPIVAGLVGKRLMYQELTGKETTLLPRIKSLKGLSRKHWLNPSSGLCLTKKNQAGHHLHTVLRHRRLN